MRRKVESGKIPLVILFVTAIFSIYSVSAIQLTGDQINKFEHRLLKELESSSENTSFDVIVVYKNYTIKKFVLKRDEIINLSTYDSVAFIREPRTAFPQVYGENLFLAGLDDLHNLGLDGDGVHVAIIDLGFKNLFSYIPDNARVAEIKSFRDDGDSYADEHGSYCARTLISVAPKANLHLYSIRTETDFIDAIEYAIGKGIDVISISVGWIADPFDGTGPLSKAVDEAVQSGIFVVVSAGNYGDKHYEGNFTDIDNDGWHNFKGYDEILDIGDVPEGEEIYVSLTWDEWPFSSTDYDLYLVFKNGTKWEIVEESKTKQNGYQEPAEIIDFITDKDGRYGISVYGRPNQKSLHFEIYSNQRFLEYNVAESSIASPGDARYAITVGAIDDLLNLRKYSSRGPTNDGRVKPDYVLPDRISVGGEMLYGTSFSAPEFAGMIACLLSAESMTPWLANRLILESYEDLGDEGKDNLYGYGYVDPTKLADAFKNTYLNNTTHFSVFVIRYNTTTYLVYEIANANSLETIFFNISFSSGYTLNDFHEYSDFYLSMKKIGTNYIAYVGMNKEVSVKQNMLISRFTLMKKNNSVTEDPSINVETVIYNGNIFVANPDVEYIESPESLSFDFDNDSIISDWEYSIFKDLSMIDRKIDDTELLKAISMWISGKLNDTNLLEYITLWIGG